VGYLRVCVSAFDNNCFKKALAENNNLALTNVIHTTGAQRRQLCKLYVMKQFTLQVTFFIFSTVDRYDGIMASVVKNLTLFAAVILIDISRLTPRTGIRCTSSASAPSSLSVGYTGTRVHSLLSSGSVWGK
jgi:hypothetical protein